MKRLNLIIGFLLVMVLMGCHGSQTTPLPDTTVELVWPKPPAKARIRFLYTVSQPKDMNISPGLWGRFFKLLKGEKAKRIVRPYGLEVDPAGRLLVVDTFLRLVHVFDPKGATYYTFPTRGAHGFISPIDIALDQKGNIYISDSQRGVVKIFQDQGKRFVKELGQEVLKRPTGLAINQKTGELLVVDTLLSCIYRYDLNNYRVKGVIGQIGKTREGFLYPTNIFVSQEGKIYVTDSLNFRIKVFTAEGELLRVFGASGDSPGYFSSPKGVAVDSEGHIYVVDGLFDNVQIFDPEGRLLLAFGSPGSKPGEFWLPAGIFIDQRDNIYVADSYNQRIQVFKYLK